MEAQDTLPQVYRELADWYDRRGEPSMRDRFFVLGIDAAQRVGRHEEAEKMRHRLLQVNPHHMLRPFASFGEASQAADVQTYLRDLRMNYPSEVALELLRSLRANAHRLAPEVARAEAESNATLDPFKSHAGPNPAPNGQRATAKPAAPIPFRSEPELKRPLAKGAKCSPPDPSPRQTPRSHNQTQPSGRWFGMVLFVVLFFAGMALAGYVAVRPFVPEVVNAVKTQSPGK
jgi:hypothetical protein